MFCRWSRWKPCLSEKLLSSKWLKKKKKNDPNQHQVQLRTFIVFRGPCVKVWPQIFKLAYEKKRKKKPWNLLIRKAFGEPLPWACTIRAWGRGEGRWTIQWGQLVTMTTARAHTPMFSDCTHFHLLNPVWFVSVSLCIWIIVMLLNG